MDTNGSDHIQQLDDDTQLPESIETHQVHKQPISSPYHTNKNHRSSVNNRTLRVDLHSPNRFRKSVRYKEDDKRLERTTPIKKVIRCNSESSSVNSIPGLDWDSQVDIIIVNDLMTSKF